MEPQCAPDQVVMINQGSEDDKPTDIQDRRHNVTGIVHDVNVTRCVGSRMRMAHTWPSTDLERAARAAAA